MLMKHIHLSGLFTLTLLFTLGACQAKKKTTSSSSSNVVTTTTGGFTSGTSTGGYTSGTSTGGSTTGTTSGTTTGGTTTGTVTGGSSSAYAVTVAMSGNGSSCESIYPTTACDSWFMGMVPPDQSGVTVGEFIPLNSNNISFFAADAYFKVRATVLPQPQISNTTNGPYCWGRKYPVAQSTIYSKMQFQLGIRDITRNGSGFSIGQRYAMISSGVLSLNSQLIFDFSPRLNPTTQSGAEVVGYAVDIYDVQSDSNCQGTSPGCVTSLVKEGSCWSVKLELANDVNRPF